MVPPFSKSWIVKDWLIAGPTPVVPYVKETQIRLDRLVGYGIRRWIDLREVSELDYESGLVLDYWEFLQSRWPDKGLKYFRIGIPDMRAPTVEQVETVIHELKDPTPTYIHCYGGHGRTGTLVGCFLVSEGASVEEALKTIKELRADDPFLASVPSPQTEEQVEFIRQWYRICNRTPI